MFGQVAQAESSPCKAFLFVFLTEAQKFGQIENFAPPKAKGSRKSLLRAEYHGLLRSVAARRNQGRTDGGKRGTIP